jgi:hypothetical protein
LKYTLILIVGPAGALLRFSFKTRERRDAAAIEFRTHGNITDDSGQFFERFGETGTVHAMLRTSDETEITQALTQSRMNAEANKQAANDPDLRAAQQRQRLLSSGLPGFQQ